MTHPEKWYIPVTEENQAELQSWWRTKAKGSPRSNLKEGRLLLSEHPTDSSGYWAATEESFTNMHPSYQKITLEQFRQITNPTPKSMNTNLFETTPKTRYAPAKPKVFGSEQDRYNRKVKAFWMIWTACFNGARNLDINKIMTDNNVGRTFYLTMRDQGIITKGSRPGQNKSLYYSDFNKVPTQQDIDKCINEQSVKIKEVFKTFKAKRAVVQKPNEMDATLKDLLAKAEEANKRVAELLSRYQSRS
jgi:hypothetical protein